MAKKKTQAIIAQPGTPADGYTLDVKYDPENNDDFEAKAIFNDGTVRELESGGSGGAQNVIDGSAVGSVRTSGSAAEDANYTIGQYAFTECFRTKASGYSAHAEGYQTEALGNYAHAEGNRCSAAGASSHAEGQATVASANESHAEGRGTIANMADQHVQGKYNVADSNRYAFIIGNGTSDNARSNAFAIKWDGTIVVWNNGAAVELTPAKIAELIA